jgi:coenzyme F420-0:L-glutamate ligase/coenzyme F420-1:gamma-L-glutamate ligase
MLVNEGLDGTEAAGAVRPAANQVLAMASSTGAIPPVLTARRTVRFYTNARVPADLVRTLIEAAICAPSAHNAQPTRFVVIESPEVKQRLAQRMARRWRQDMEQLRTPEAAIKVELRFSLRRFGEAPALILVGYTMDGMDVYPDRARRAAEHAMAVQSAAAAVQNLLLAAAANGLGACWCCAPLFCPGLVRRTLGLPRAFVPQALLTLGRPAHTPPVPPRKSFDAVVTVL